MSDPPKTTRCTVCTAEFTDAEISSAKACPACGDPGVPCDIAKDLTVRVNWHELRIICMWADNWARERCDDDGRKTVTAIVERLEAQRPSTGRYPPLTFMGEVKELEALGHHVEVNPPLAPPKPRPLN